MAGQGGWPSEKIVLRNGRPFLPEPSWSDDFDEEIINAELRTSYDQGDFEAWMHRRNADGLLDVTSMFSNPSILGPLCQMLEQEVKKKSKTDLSQGTLCFLLGTILLRRIEIMNTTNRGALLDMPLYYLTQAINILPKDDPRRATSWGLYALGVAFKSLNSDQLIDVDTSYPLRQGQLALDMANDDESYTECLRSLALILRYRYAKTNQVADIHQGVLYLQQALAVPSIDDSTRVSMLNNLGNLLGDLFVRTNHTADIEMAIEHYDNVNKVATQDSHTHSVLLNNLAVKLNQRAKITTDIADIDMAIQCGETVVATVSSDDPNHPAVLKNLAMFLMHRFSKTHKLADLDQVVHIREEVIIRTPENHPDLASRLLHLGHSLRERGALLRDGYDLSNSLEVYARGFETDCSPIDRILCGIQALKISSALPVSYWKHATRLAERILEMIPNLLQRTASRNDTQYILRQIFGISSLSISILLKMVKSPLELIQMLEKYRGIIISSTIDIKSEVSELKEQYPDLWSRYTQCRDSLGAMNSIALKLSTEKTYAANIDRVSQIYDALNIMKQEIRSLTGFERFLLPLTEKDIYGLARTGPIALFNVSRLSSEVFLITTDGIQLLSLPGLKYQDVQQWVKRLARYGNSARRDADLSEDDEEQEEAEGDGGHILDIGAILKSLWKVAVKPVLQQLKMLNQGSKNHMPRIWWVTAGLMGLIPLHAAGDHSEGSMENTLSYAISSYTPTLKSLQFVQSRPQVPMSKIEQKLLLVSMPVTPGESAPLNVSEEVRAVENSASQWVSVTTLERPDKETVLEALKTCTIAHFACHGTADPLDPGKSALLVGKEQIEKLTIEDLDAISCQHARIVYLSACSTAELKMMSLADESIHLASTFQLAGFQHAIGTLWGADDSAAVIIAQSFYKTLLQPDGDGSISVARALHHAILSFRDSGNNRKDIFKWAPFVHLGC